MEPLLQSDAARPKKPAFWKLYLSHLLSTFGDRLWQFAVPVLFMTIWNDTLLPGAAFNFIVNLVTSFVFPNIGAWVDRTPRKKLMAISVFGEASTMVLAALGFWPMLALLPSESSQEKWTSPPLTPAVAVCYAGIVICSTLTEMLMQAGTIALELDWPAKLVLKEIDQDGKWLAEVNSTMTSIAQFSLLAGPAAFGAILQLASNFVSSQGARATVDLVQSAVLIILAWNLICVPFEWFTLASLYAASPQLAFKESSGKKKKKEKSFFKELAGGWKTFIGHRFALPSVSGVLISFTVLNSSAVSTAWFVWAGIPLGFLGFLRGGAAVSGLIGGWTYRWLYTTCGESAVRTAQMGICTFALLLIPCGLSMAVFGSTVRGAWTLLLLITASRFALFWFKPAMTQLTQEHVSEDVRGSFQGTKKSLNKLFTVGIAAVAMVFPNPKQFPYLVYMSCTAVAMAAAFFCVWMWTDAAAMQRKPST